MIICHEFGLLIEEISLRWQSHRMPLNFYGDVKAENRQMLFQSEEKTFFLSLPLSQCSTILGSSSTFSFIPPFFSYTVQSTCL